MYFIGLNNLASLLEQAGDTKTSLAMFTEVMRDAEHAAATSDDPRLPTYRQNLGRSLMLNGQLDAARPLLAADVEGNLDTVNLNVERGRRLAHLAEWMRRSGRHDEALRYVDQAAAVFTALYPNEHARHGAIARTRGLILRDQHRLAEAEGELRRAAGILARTAGKNANATIETELQLAGVLAELGRIDEARTLHERVEPLLVDHFVEHSLVREQHAALARRLALGNG
jgi:serine/threonine-protein kinase